MQDEVLAGRVVGRCGLQGPHVAAVPKLCLGITADDLEVQRLRQPPAVEAGLAHWEDSTPGNRPHTSLLNSLSRTGGIHMTAKKNPEKKSNGRVPTFTN